MKINSLKSFPPNARIFDIDINGKSLTTPSYFPTIKHTRDGIKWVMDAFKTMWELEETTNIYPNIGGFVVEAQETTSILKKHLDYFTLLKKEKNLTLQSTLSGKKPGNITEETKFENFYSFLSSFHRLLIIDPNTDRMVYSTYRDKFANEEKKGGIGNYLPKTIRERIRELIILSEENKKLKHSEISNTQVAQRSRQIKEIYTEEIIAEGIEKEMEKSWNILVPNFIDIQRRYKSDIIVAPYCPISLENHEEQLRVTLNLYKFTSHLTSRLMKEIPMPILCIKRNVLSELPLKRRSEEYPLLWSKIISGFENLDAPMLGVKITDFNTDSMDERYEELFYFLKLIRERIDKPIILFGMNEFFYVLYYKGLDCFSLPICKSAFIRGFGRDPEAPPPPTDRKYYLPRKMQDEYFTNLEKPLPCDCPFCSVYDDVEPSDIKKRDQEELRFKHYLWVKNDELRQIIDATKKNSLRVGLVSMFEDTKWKKNFVGFLR